MNIKIREHRPGKFQIYFSHQGKQIFINRGVDNQPLRRIEDAYLAVFFLQNHGYHPKEWGKDHTFHFEVAAQNWVKLSQISPEWRRERKRLIEQVYIPYFGKTDIRTIQTIHVQGLLLTLRDKDYSDKYIKNVMNELKTFFRFNRKSLPELPEFDKITVQNKPIKWLTSDEQDRVFEFIPERHQPIFTFLRSYGCRLNEACGLTRDTIYLKHDHPYFVIKNVYTPKSGLKPYTKTKKAKTLPILSELEWLFKPTAVTPIVPYVFHRNGKPYTTKTLYEIWARASKKANKVYKTPIVNAYNALRHSFGCSRLNEGYSIDEIATVMGHTDTRTTKRYAEFMVDKLSGVIRGKKTGHTLYIPSEKANTSESKGKLVSRAGIEPATY